MAHDYAVTVGGTALSTLADYRFTKYTSGTRRGGNLVLPYKHGELFVPDKYFTESDVLLEVFLPSDSHDAAAEVLSTLAELLSSQSLVTVTQTDPYRGDIQARVELVTDPVETQNQLVYMFGLRNPAGFWEDQTPDTATSANPPSVTTGGDRPIDDMVLTFAGTGFLEHTDTLGQVSRIEIESGAGGTTPYVVDVGAATIVDSAGTPVTKDEFLVVTQPWWMKWQPGVAQSFTSDVNVAASWRNKWS